MSPALFADLGISLGTYLLGGFLLGIAVLGAVGDGWWGSANRARNATGGPVPPATTRDHIWVTICMTIAVVCMFVGLYYMKR